jgi:hypothetical protein
MGFGPSKREQDALDAQTGRARAEGQKAKRETARADQLFKAAEPNIGALSTFFRGLMTGDRGILGKVFGSQLEDVRRTAGATRENILQNVPGGGASSAALAGVEQGVGSVRGGVLQGAPGAGASGISDLFGTLLGGSAQQGQLASGSFAGQGAGLQSILKSEADRRKAKLGFLGGIGSSLGGGFGGFIGSKIFGSTGRQG